MILFKRTISKINIYIIRIKKNCKDCFKIFTELKKSDILYGPATAYLVWSWLMETVKSWLMVYPIRILDLILPD